MNASTRIPRQWSGFKELANSSVNLIAWPWVMRSDFLAVKMDLNEKVKAVFESSGCSMPFPQRDVHLHTVKATGT